MHNKIQNQYGQNKLLLKENKLKSNIDYIEEERIVLEEQNTNDPKNPILGQSTFACSKLHLFTMQVLSTFVGCVGQRSGRSFHR